MAYKRWTHSDNYSLRDVYGIYSKLKENAYAYCEDLVDKYDGYGLRIIGHNSMAFSVGFIGYIDGLKHFFYITRDYDRALPLEYVDKDGVVFENLFAF